MGVFDSWDNEFCSEELLEDLEEIEKNNPNQSYDEVPVGDYEIRIEKMELKESQTGKPMFSCWFRILEGSYENKILFWNQVLTQSFQINIVNKFLRSLGAYDKSTISFKNYSQYNNLILDIAELIDTVQAEFLINFKKNKKGFPTYTIKEIYVDEQ